MQFASPLTQAILLKRYKRFLAEVVINNQECRVIYCPNMGAMTGCDILGSRVWFSHIDQSKRKIPDTWTLVEVDAGFLVCVDTRPAQALILEGIKNGIIKELTDHQILAEDETGISTEYDLELVFQIPALKNETALDSLRKCFVDVKSVTLGDEIHRGFFPDAPTEKGLQQLKGLIHAKEMGHRAILIFCVQHTGIERLFPADHIDALYGTTLRQAILAGVEILAYGLEITLQEMHIARTVEVCIPARMICSSR